MFSSQFWRTHPRLGLVLAALLWSTSGVCVKFLTTDAVTIAAWRSFVTAIFVFAILPEARKFRLCSFSFLISYSIAMGSFILATKLIGAAAAVFLQYSGPVLAIVLEAYINKKLPIRRDILSMISILIGFSLVCQGALQLSSFLGVAYALISALTFGLVLFLSNSLPQERTLPSVAYGNVLTWVALVSFSTFPTAPVEIGILIYLGIFQLGCAYILFTISSSAAKLTDSALIPYLEPVMNPIWVWFFLHEYPSTKVIIGGFVVIGTLVVRSLLEAHSKNQGKMMERDPSALSS